MEYDKIHFITVDKKTPSMLTKKQRLEAMGLSYSQSIPTPATPVRRRGVDKSQPDDPPVIQITPPLEATKLPIIEELMDDESEEMDATQPIFDEDEEDSDLDELASEAFREEAKFWMDQYAPKMFDIAVSKWLTKKDKIAVKSLSVTPPKSTSPPKKKQRIS